MSAKFLRPSGGKETGPAPWVAADDIIDPSPRAKALAGRACCCAARAAVEVIMPATAGRPHRTQLLLCGHHYRASRPALIAARATIRALPGTSSDVTSWIGVEA